VPPATGRGRMETGAGRTAVVIGATGLVGVELVAQLLADPRFAAVVVLARRATGVAHPRLREHLVDLGAPGPWEALVAGDALLSALGTTLAAAGSPAAQYRVDHDAQLRVAAAARRNGVPACVIVSSAGASPSSRLFYSRMKGELERDVEALGFPRTRFLRPGPLDGPRRERRTAERWMLRALRPLAPLLPAVARPVHAAIVARAAIAAALDPAPGVARWEPAALFRMGAAPAARG
jgi:uncharacterized protein YbjT (DUF2867 family)